MTEKDAICPFSPATLPGDGTPLEPSPTFAKWRAGGPAVPLQYQDGHEGLVSTDYDFARSILEDPRFSMRPQRMPMGPTGHIINDDLPNAANPSERPGPLDTDGQISEQSNLLIMDGEEHSRLRRLVTPRFSLRQARGRRDWISGMVAEQLKTFKSGSQPGDVWIDYARPIAAKTHCRVIGIPDSEYGNFVRLFVDSSTAQQKYDFIRKVLAMRTGDTGEDVISDLLSSDEITRHETEGILGFLLAAGRDSVAYLIATTTVALLTNPDQLDLLRAEPERIDAAIEEVMRFGAMFVTVFPRTALEDVNLKGVLIRAGQSVSVSPVAANRDPVRWDNPDNFDITRDAFGHLGFSHGIHGCIGQQLARVEIGEGVRQLIQGLPGLNLVHAEQMTPMPFAHPVAVYEAGSVMVRWEN